jgi:hypothetical protein
MYMDCTPFRFQLILIQTFYGTQIVSGYTICRRHCVKLLAKALIGHCAKREPFVSFLQRSHCFLLFCGKIGSYDLGSRKLT